MGGSSTKRDEMNIIATDIYCHSESPQEIFVSCGTPSQGGGIQLGESIVASLVSP